ncbi:MAG: family 20 glycosylhydrolase [Candidatus Eremiobacteraeota bacterium]|nr:family 20 glycosylhydrolase [Candidatus Eremiobacteraeota bacterium]
MRTFLVAAVVFVVTASAASAQPALVPQPRSVHACPGGFALNRPLRFPYGTDPGGFEIVRERWSALGIPAPVVAARRAPADVQLSVGLDDDVYQGRRTAQPGYHITVTGSLIEVVDMNDDGPRDGFFDALATLAQLPERRGAGWVLPCVQIDDAPAMRWRIVSDDVSRGPFPTMAYAKERIRTLASLKINGWSPYMEMVVADPRTPFVAWPNGWTPAQLHELAVYARRFHVTLIPEQQTFAHMHESLKWEALAPLAELPHGYLLAESDSRTYAYLEPLVKSVVEAAKPTPFVHLGSDEPIDLGRGRTARTPQTFADHVKHVASFLAGSGARPMIWDDAIQQDHSILSLLPKDTVIVTWHYGAEKTFRPYIDVIANAGFDQLVAPGASNWTEIYPDVSTAYTNIARLVADGKGRRGVLGMFATDWHDDGETLYEATWAPLAYAAASAWQAQPVDDATWSATFARAFFGTDDVRYARDLDALAAIRNLLRTEPSDPINYVFWRDPFDSRLQARAQKLDLAGVRTRAEAVLTDLWTARPPLHAQAAAVMKLGALRYDMLARRLQIGKEARDYYEDARAHATKPGVSLVFRSLNVAKYECWEMRDALANLEPLYAAAWRYENTAPGLERFETRLHLALDQSQRDADRLDAASREDYERNGTLPTWDEVMPSVR